MGLFSWLKLSPASSTPDDRLSPEEAEVGLAAAKVAGNLMRLQISTASRFAAAAGKNLKDFTWEVQAFAFGVLVASIEQKGIPWFKVPNVILPFCDAYMPEYEDKKEIAKLVLHFGTSNEHTRYAEAGRSAMVRFAHSPHAEPTVADLDDLAIALGFERRAGEA